VISREQERLASKLVFADFCSSEHMQLRKVFTFSRCSFNSGLMPGIGNRKPGIAFLRKK
jgi:hypothetical protein